MQVQYPGLNFSYSIIVVNKKVFECEINIYHCDDDGYFVLRKVSFYMFKELDQVCMEIKLYDWAINGFYQLGDLTEGQNLNFQITN